MSAAMPLQPITRLRKSKCITAWLHLVGMLGFWCIAVQRLCSVFSWSYAANGCLNLWLVSRKIVKNCLAPFIIVWSCRPDVPHISMEAQPGAKEVRKS